MRGQFSEDDVRDLIRRKRSILVKLQTLSYGTTTSVDTSGIAERQHERIGKNDPKAPLKRALAASPGVSGRRAMETKLPPGVKALRDLSETVDGPPSRNDDLHGHYLWRFNEAKGYWAVLNLCAQAEIEYQREVKGNTRQFDMGTARESRIVENYAGKPYWEVATWEDMHPEAVKRLRREAGLDPEYGVEAETDPRTLRVLELKKLGMSQRAIAMEIGVSQTRVSQLISGAA